MLSEADFFKMLAAEVHVGASNCVNNMVPYVYSVQADGTRIIDLSHTMEKITLAARILAAVKNTKDIAFVAGRPQAHRAVHKFCANVGATALCGTFIPGSFTNRESPHFIEPSVIVVNDPRIDHQAIREASYMNIPVIALCSTDAPLRFIDCVIPCNNKGVQALGLVYWILCREVLHMKSQVTRDEWEVMPDMFFYQKAEDIERIEREIREANEPAEVEAAEWTPAAYEEEEEEQDWA